jgi:hypothetical protein
LWELLFVNLVGTYLSLKGELDPSKRGQKPLFEGKKGFPQNVQYQNVPAEFSFGIGWKNTGKIPTNTEPKYRIGVQF